VERMPAARRAERNAVRDDESRKIIYTIFTYKFDSV